MRIVALPERLALYAMGGGVMLAVAGPPAAVAQSRSAAIAVVATVRGAADADVIGAHAVAAIEWPASSTVRATPESEGWRITSGRNGQIGLQVESVDTVAGDSAAFVTICDDAAAEPATCRRHQTSHLAVRTDVLSDFVVRVGRTLSGKPTPQVPMRLTVAFIAF
jgi:hypothetical protein